MWSMLAFLNSGQDWLKMKPSQDLDAEIIQVFGLLQAEDL